MDGQARFTVLEDEANTETEALLSDGRPRCEC